MSDSLGSFNDFTNYYEKFPLIYIQNCCPLCNSKKLRPVTTEMNSLEGASSPDVRRFTGTWIQLLKCNDCEFAFTKEIPQDPFFFDKRYDIRFNPEVESKTTAKDHIIETIFNDLKKLGCHGGELLDIGSFGGVFLKAAQRKNFIVHGIEVNPTMAKYTKDVLGLDVVNGKFLDTKLNDNFYDLITMIDVLEHLVNPRSVLEKCFVHLKKGGVIVIKVPNYKQQLLKQKIARFIGISRQGIFENFGHINHFSPSSLSNVLADIGYEVLGDYASESEYWQGEGLKYKIKNSFRWMFSESLKIIKKLTGKNYSLNFTIIARKK